MKVSSKHSRLFLYLFGFLLIAVLTKLDILVGPEITFSTPYFLIAAYFVWFLGLWPGILAAIFVSIFSILTNTYIGVHYPNFYILILKILLRSIVFIILVIILHRLQDSQRKLKETITQLEQKNHELDNFNSIVSHDLQAPLSTVKMLCQFLERDRSENNKRIDQIKETIERMLQLVKNLLSYAKSTPATYQTINLNILINELLKDLEALKKEKNGTIELDSLPNIHGDPIQIRQLFQNLISNALKYSKSQEAPIIKIYSKSNLHSVEIYVQDNGLGFNEQELNKIFLPFQRLSTDNEGTGIGLPICKKIVEQLGGEITANSKLNEGSRFIIRLPKR